MKWGMPFPEESWDRYIATRDDPSFGGIRFYRKVGDELKIGGAELVSIEYGFWQNKLSTVVIVFSGWSNFSGVKDAAVQKFGPAIQPNRYIEEYFGLSR